MLRQRGRGKSRLRETAPSGGCGASEGPGPRGKQREGSSAPPIAPVPAPTRPAASPTCPGAPYRAARAAPGAVRRCRALPRSRRRTRAARGRRLPLQGSAGGAGRRRRGGAEPPGERSRPGLPGGRGAAGGERGIRGTGGGRGGIGDPCRKSSCRREGPARDGNGLLVCLRQGARKGGLFPRAVGSVSIFPGCQCHPPSCSPQPCRVAQH